MNWQNWQDEDGSIHSRFINGRITIKINSIHNDASLPLVAFKQFIREIWPASWDLWNYHVGTKLLTSMKESLPGEWLAAFDQKCVNDMLEELFEIGGNHKGTADNKYSLKILLPQLLCKTVLAIHAITINFAVRNNDVRESLETNNSWSPKHKISVLMFCVCWWSEINGILFDQLSKWIDVRSLKMYDLLCERLFGVAWCIYHADLTIDRFQSKQKLFQSFIDTTYYGCPSRILGISLPAFFNMAAPDIAPCLWNTHLQPNHVTLKNSNYGILLWQALKTHVSPFLKSFWGSGQVNNFPGLSHFDMKNQTIAELIESYDKSWQDHSKFKQVKDVVNNLLNSSLSFSPKFCFGLSKFVRENIEEKSMFISVCICVQCCYSNFWQTIFC